MSQCIVCVESCAFSARSFIASGEISKQSFAVNIYQPQQQITHLFLLHTPVHFCLHTSMQLSHTAERWTPSSSWETWCCLFTEILCRVFTLMQYLLLFLSHHSQFQHFDISCQYSCCCRLKCCTWYDRKRKPLKRILYLRLLLSKWN